MHKTRVSVLAAVLLFLLLFSVFAYSYLSLDLWDYDFWWHISTGRLIVETGSLPDADPFSFVSTLQENENLRPKWENFVLKQYWLCQILFYFIFIKAGPAGIIILRTALLLLTILVVLWQLRRWGVSFYICFVLVFLLFLVTTQFTGERPVLFSILFTPVVFIMLEDFKHRRGKLLYLLPPLMLLWANIHGGFIIGNIMIMVYMAVEGLKALFKKVEYPKNRLALFYGITTLSLAFSYINPTGWDAFLIALSPKYAFLQKDVQEYASPFFHYLNKLQGINTGYAVLACLFPILLIIRNKKMDLAQAILVAGLFIMAAKSSRFIAFFGPVAVMVTGKETNILLQDLLKNRATKRIQKAGASVFILFLLSITVFFLAYGNFRGINFGVAKNRTVPVQAVDFMERNRLPGNIYNSPAFGGYITWRAYPDRMTFIDTRWINSTVQFEWRWINDALDSIYSEELHEGRQPLWRRLLDHYNINLIMINLMDAYGTAPELLLKLPEDRQWALVYADSICAIFVRNVPAYEHIIEQFEQPKENIYNIIIAESAYKSVYKQNPNYLITLGKTFYAMGRLEDAVTAYRYASKRMPGNLWIKKKVDETEAELKQKNED